MLGGTVRFAPSRDSHTHVGASFVESVARLALGKAEISQGLERASRHVAAVGCRHFPIGRAIRVKKLESSVRGLRDKQGTAMARSMVSTAEREQVVCVMGSAF